MNGQHGTRARILTCVVAGVAVAVTWAGAVAPARAAAQGMTTGVRPPGAGDASAIGAARPAGSWGRAIEVPGLGALNKSGDAEVLSVSCGSAGNCAAGGDYQAFSRHGPQHEFVVSERHGRWGRAIRVPGLGALNKGYAGVLSVSCASAGNCAAGGDYTDRRGYGQGFVVSQRHGVWGRAIEVPGLGALNTAGGAEVTAVSCASAGNCAAGGDYTDRRGNVQGFVASERDGVWGRAIEVPGLGALNVGGDAFVDFNSVSCGSAGNCAAGGEYDAFVASGQGFVVVERHGRWRRAIEMPGPGALNAGVSEVLSVSCGSAGNCAAGGDYTDRRGHGQGFVASERDGVWGQAIEVPGLGALNTAGGAEVTAVSCASAGNCAAGGGYGGQSGGQGFVASERDGVWGPAIEVPGLGALNKGGDASVSSVSCASAGNCAAGGDYSNRPYDMQGFVAVERHGRWRTAIEVPGLRALNKGGNAQVTSVSCAPAGTCAAGGSYPDRYYHYQGFVVSQTG